MAWTDANSKKLDEEKQIPIETLYPRTTPTVTVLAGLKNVFQGLDLFSDADWTTEIVLVNATTDSMKIAWASSRSPEKGREHYDLQWKLEGTDVWNSLPSPLNVPKIRFDHLLPEAAISFRVRSKKATSSTWSNFSRVATFRTVQNQATTLCDAELQHVSSNSALLDKVTSSINDTLTAISRLPAIERGGPRHLLKHGTC